MKKLILFTLMAILILSPTSALNTTISTNIYVDSILGSSYLPSSEIPNRMRRVTFINRAQDIPELETALSAASSIFTNAMAQEDIDLIPLKVIVLTEDLGEDFNIICKVDINYTDTIYSNNINYPYFANYGNNRPVLVPMAMANQSNGAGEKIAMTIRLRSNIPYHCDITPAPEDKYDAITILLRALAMGCGIQSTFNSTNLTVGIEADNEIYVNAFDTKIYNEDHIPLTSIADGDVSANTFFAGKEIYANGCFGTYENPTPITLFNDRKEVLSNSFTDLTSNTIDPDIYTEDEILDNYYDLLDPFIPQGISVREVTSYTMALLRNLGWDYDVPVGENPYADLYQSKLLCSGYTLSPNTNYSVWMNKSNLDLPINTLHCNLQTSDSVYSIGAFSGNSYSSYSFSYADIPSNIQWRRNPITKNIIGQITGVAGKLVDWNYSTQEKLCDIEIPYKPNKPIVRRNETASLNNVNLNIHAFANGSDNYTLTYVGLADSISHTLTITAEVIDTVISLPATQLYDFTILGSNTQGNSDPYHFTMGASVVPELFLNIFMQGNTLRYYLDSDLSQNLPCVNINSVVITNSSGNTFIISTAMPGDAINISSLPRGYYLLTVVANGQPYSKLFYKR